MGAPHLYIFGALLQWSLSTRRRGARICAALCRHLRGSIQQAQHAQQAVPP